MLVRSIMIEDVDSVSAESSLKDAYSMIERKRYDSLPVVSGRQPVGVISLMDILKGAVGKADFDGWLSGARVRDYMVERLVTIGPDETLEKAAYLMFQHDIPLLPVVDEGRLVGLVAEADLFKALGEMLGVSEPGSRITLLSPEKQGQLARIAEIIARAGVNISRIATFKSEVLGQYKIVVRVDTQTPSELVGKLEAAGFKVIHVS